MDNVQAVHSSTRYALSKGRKIAYRTIGEGEPILLCNRIRGNLDDWDPAFLDALAKHFQVITFNYSGMASSTGALATTIMDFALDVEDLADYFNFKQVIVAGWSIGGFVAQAALARFPERISHVVLIGTKPAGKVNHPTEEIIQNTAFKPQYSIEDEITLFFESSSEVSKKAAKESHERRAKRSFDKDLKVKEEHWKAYAKAAEDFENDPYHIRETLQKTRIPILLISAAHEKCFPPENWFELKPQPLTTQFLILPQCGHAPHHQYPGMIAAYMDSFVKNT